MEIINNLLHGIRTGEYWFIRIAAIMNMASILLVFIIDRRNYKTNEDRNNAMNFGVRLFLATLMIFVSCKLFAVIPGPHLKWILIGACAIVIIMMIKVDKLPIWMEEEK